MEVTVNRKAHFNAAHRLYRKDWSFEKTMPFLVNATTLIFMGITTNL
ncbi:6-pyruvoyl tetrahydrobiopterin synthase [Algibacter lectus]|uniref:6-pyruvoyl tetrahydrobiopterin synthase n=1 Tax=Algibacter lectus TaxID=221126 RepID=A0A090WS17_9FLAO|nr:6-pyruvoyl tetrahydrobiopterin synthase [Algibacter lectus]